MHVLTNTGISAVQHTCVSLCHGGADPASGTRLSFALWTVRGGGCVVWAAPKRCDGISDVAYRIGEGFLAGTRVVVFATRAEPVVGLGGRWGWRHSWNGCDAM